MAPLSSVLRRVRLPLLILALLLLPVVPPVPLAFATEITKDITEDTVWSKGGSPYEVKADVKLLLGKTLSIEPGAEIKFVEGAGLSIEGTLLANGTVNEPITFTGLYPGSWDGLGIIGTLDNPNVNSVLNYVIAEYGGNFSFGGNLYLEHAYIRLANSTFRSGNAHGIHIGQRSSIHVTNVTLSNNKLYALMFCCGGADPVLQALVATGNGVNGIGLGVHDMVTGTYVWENAGIPYIIYGDQHVQRDAILVINPGVEVQFGQSAMIMVRGHLDARGTVNSRILFTGTEKIPGWWDGLHFDGPPELPATGTLHYITVEYGGVSGTLIGANVYIEDANLDISQSTFRRGGGNGIYAASQGVANISDAIFSTNPGYAVYFSDLRVNPTLARLTAIDNGKNAIVLGNGNISSDQTWEAAGLPYIISGNIIVDKGAKLIIEPAVRVHFAQHTRLDVLGTLLAVGTSTASIVFTGDFSNGTGSAGWWDGISFFGLAQSLNIGSQLSHVTIEYGGYNSSPSLSMIGGQVPITHAVVRYSGGDGIYIGQNSSGTSIHDSVIIDNAKNGITVVGSGINLTKGAPVRRTGIYNNGKLGIDLGNDGVSRNDLGDADSGPNDQMNFPAGLTISPNGANTEVSGYLETLAPQLNSVDIYVNEIADPLGFGEGQRYIGSVTPNSAGAFTLMVEGQVPFSIVTATATNSYGSTSEFSAKNSHLFGRITSPLNNTTLGPTTVNFAADALSNSDVGIRFVEFFVFYDGSWHSAGKDESLPYGIQWQTPNKLRSQQLKFAIHITDNMGSVSEYAGGISVVNYVESLGNNSVVENWVPYRVYLNQRSLAPNGDSKCSVASMAMVLAMNGVVGSGYTTMRDKANEMFPNVRQNNQTNRGLMAQELNNQGVSAQLLNLPTADAWQRIKTEIDKGRPVIVFTEHGVVTASGHIIVAIGYRETNGERQIITYDPYGKWKGTCCQNNYDRNTVDSESHKGQWVFYDFNTIVDINFSLLTVQRLTSTSNSYTVTSTPSTSPDVVSNEKEDIGTYEGISITSTNSSQVFLPLIMR
jgi:hypothetical protein